jgi:dynactin complex subunit
LTGIVELGFNYFKCKFDQIIFIRHGSKTVMRKFIEPFDKRNRSTNPENGTRRIEKETDGINHLQIFYNGSWRHDQKCKLKTNKECTIGV